MATAAPVVVVGGGIIGASIAYHLTLKGVAPVVVEGTRVAAAASGKAGGFLARGWGDGSATEELHRVSFAMHEQLAEKLAVESYRKLPTMSVRAGRGKAGHKHVPWLDKDVSGCSLMDADTAQVSPRELTEKLMAAAVAGGATLVHGAVEGVVSDPAGDESNAVALRGVVVDGKEILAERVVFALGPWSVLLERWIPGQVIPMEGVKSTSIVFQHEQGSVAPIALFCEEDRNGCHLEVYPRPNGEVYMCGLGGSEYRLRTTLAHNSLAVSLSRCLAVSLSRCLSV
jgi:glycine/D-amino acid oxidase-like deaminating enzyme